MTKIIKCENCNKLKLAHSKDLCSCCYMKKYNYEIKSKLLYNFTNEGYQIQIRLYYNLNTDNITITSTQQYRKRPKNQSCSNYLGIIIAEQVLSKVFKNIQQMPNGNPGYDFICDKGYKVDVKSCCLSKGKYWVFSINKNTTTDYFLCLAFDNRQDLNPLHLWLIPGNILNNITTTSITKSTLLKWNEYKLDINKVISYCNNMRGD